LKGNFNQYTLTAYGDTATSDTITIEITQRYTAYRYLNIMEPGCSAVNTNDYIGHIYIYNADVIGATTPYDAVMTMNNGN